MPSGLSIRRNGVRFMKILFSAKNNWHICPVATELEVWRQIGNSGPTKEIYSCCDVSQICYSNETALEYLKHVLIINRQQICEMNFKNIYMYFYCLDLLPKKWRTRIKHRFSLLQTVESNLFDFRVLFCSVTTGDPWKRLGFELYAEYFFK